MEVIIFSKKHKEINEKDLSPFINKGGIIIAAFNNTLFKAGRNSFIVIKVNKDHEAFNQERLEEIAICKDLIWAKVIAKQIAIEEKTNFIIN